LYVFESQVLYGLQCTHATLAQDFTFEWVTQRYTMVASSAYEYEAAITTLCGMAGRLTALVVPSPAAEHLTSTALLAAGPLLVGALSSLSFSFAIGDTVQLYAATHAVLAVSAGLQRLDLGLGSIGSKKQYSAPEIQGADALFQHLMRSLPCCQTLCLGACGALSHQAMGRELLQHEPHLVSLTLHTGQFDEQVSTDPSRAFHHHPGASCHPVDRMPKLQQCCLSPAKHDADSYIELGLCLQLRYTDTILQELSSMTWLTRLHISVPDYQAASGSLQCLSALRRLRDLKVVDMQPPGSRIGLGTVLPLSYCTALTRRGNLYVPDEVHTRGVC
jgi:hypothetical protein